MTRNSPVLVCFDFEGQWGMPFAAPYDLEPATHSILDCLDRHDARAVFFTVGRLAVEYPELLVEIAGRGHELALHGWNHEHIDRLTAAETTEFRAGLKEAAAAMGALSGETPTGFRAPYLLGPRFADPPTYRLLKDLGYRWASNREIRHPVELLRPDRIRTARPWRAVQSRSSGRRGGLISDALTCGLNAGLCLHDPVEGSSGVRWLAAGAPPFYRDGLLELAVSSPLDCDLVGFPEPSVQTPAPLLDYAAFALERILHGPAAVKMLTFHDWIISGGNRLSLLERLLAHLRERGMVACAPRDCWSALTALASGQPTPIGALVR